MTELMPENGLQIIMFTHQRGSIWADMANIVWLRRLNQEVKGENRDENIFEDAGLQMAGDAAALRVLTRYDFIDGKDMTKEALRPRVRGEKTIVDELIDFAVDVANRCLVPHSLLDIIHFLRELAESVLLW